MSDLIKGGVRQAIPHESAHLHVTGEAEYVDDIPELPGTLTAYILKSPKAHAKIKKIDKSKAEAVRGVHAVLDASDIPGHNDIAPIIRGEPCLAPGEVNYVGEPVAAVFAEDMHTARYAAGLIEVEYEDLPAILTIEEAFEKKSFLTDPLIATYGEPAEALKKAKHRLKGEFTIGGQDHMYLETQVAYVIPREDRQYMVYSSTQNPAEGQRGVADVLGLPFNAVKVENRRMGGGFGGKESQSTIIAAIAALGAWKTRRPVKLRLDRDDDMIITGKRHHYIVTYDVGFDDEGVMSALDIDFKGGCGSVIDMSLPVVQRTVCHGENCYFIPNVVIRGHLCKTNTVPNTAMRGFGAPQGMVGIEGVVEHIAHYLKIDPRTVRRRNFYGIEDRNVTPYHQAIEDNVIAELFDRVEKDGEYDRRRAEIMEYNRNSPYVKRGLAMSPLKFGISFNKVTLNQAGALVNVYTDGSILINQGGTEMGQGLMTKMTQVAAETFSVDIDKVRITATATDKIPNTSATAASTDSDMNGMAVKNAIDNIKAILVKFAAEHFSVPEEEVVFEANQVKIGKKQTMPFGEFVALAQLNRIPLFAAGFYKTPKIHFDAKSMTGRPFLYFCYGVCMAEVAVDILTGESHVLRADMVYDAGKSMNTAIDMGQVEGAFVQGLGWALLEDLKWNKDGSLLTHSPTTYKIPTSRDLPKVFNVALLERENREETIFHSKSSGEPPFMLGIAVWLAARDAVASIADYKLRPNLDIPCTPERTMKAIKDIRERMAKLPPETPQA
jgi:xanthine dehydrogenase large subunit